MWGGAHHVDLLASVCYETFEIRERAVLDPLLTTRTLTPFAIYCLIAGIASLIQFG